MNNAVKILIVDDERDIGELVSAYIEKAGFMSEVVLNGEEALARIRQYTYDLIILDVMMPGLNGFEVCEKIREISTTPIIMLTARSDENDRVNGLKIGADDYVLKPFSPKELVARIEALLRRASIKNTDFLQIASIKINKNARQVFLEGENLLLARREYDLLLFLMENAGQVFTREQLFTRVWGEDNEIGTLRTVDTHIKTLRFKLKEAGSLITTVWGVGYKFEE